MTTRESYAHGEFCWVDLSALDMKEAAAWYGELFGWSTQAQDTGGGPPYTMLCKGDRVVAGLGQLNDEMKAAGVPPTWNSYINVDDAKGLEAKVKELGGSVVVPAMQVMDSGWLGYYSDPGGAVFAVWQKLEHGGADLVNAPSSFCWNELATADLDEAKAFYGPLFEWELPAMPGEAPVPTAMIQNQGRENGHMLQMNEQWQGIPPHWQVYFAVENADATSARVAQTGGKLLVPPTDIPPGRFSVCSDPQGAVFTVIQLSNPPD